MQLRRREYRVAKTPPLARRSTRFIKAPVRYTTPESELDEVGNFESPSSEDTPARLHEPAIESPLLHPSLTLSPPRSHTASDRSLRRRGQKQHQSPQKDSHSKKRARRDSLLNRAVRSGVEADDDNESVELIQSQRPAVHPQPLERAASVKAIASKHRYPFASGATRLGRFSRLPREIRDIIYGYAVGLTEPVSPRQCCGIQSTLRERNHCLKHGRRTPDSGRFNLFLVSKVISIEAAYVLHNFGKLELLADWSIVPYLRDHVPKTMRRLGQLPKNDSVRAMWLNVARYRTVEILFRRNASRDTEAGGVGNIVDICALLLKAREDVGTKAHSTHSVSLNLGSLFEYHVPFGPVDIFLVLDDDPSLWGMYGHRWDDARYMAEISSKAGNALKKLIGLIKQHRGCSQWTIAAGADIDQDRAVAKRWFGVLKTDCEKGGVRFVEH